MMMKKSVIFLEVPLCGKLCVNFHSVVVKDKLYSIRLLARFICPAQALKKTCLNEHAR